MNQIKIRTPDDFHAHFRDGDTMRLVAPYHRHFARALAMPNVPAIHTGEEAVAYRARVESAAGGGLEVLPCIKLTHRTTPDVIGEARGRGVVAAKLYPSGVTTASHDGITNTKELWPVFRAMQSAGMVLSIHGEMPGSFVLDRERDYLPVVAEVVRSFPGLKVVLEHITTGEAVDFVRQASVNVAATITAHHLISTLDNVIGDGIRPHNFCYPVPKRTEDRFAIRSAAMYNNHKFIFGSDSAPHARPAKESACGCAGVFSAPVALAVLASVFFGDRPDGGNSSDIYVWERDVRSEYRRRALEDFTSRVGAEFYGLPPNEGTITLAAEDWTVPDAYGDVVPLLAGERLRWRVAEP